MNTHSLQSRFILEFALIIAPLTLVVLGQAAFDTVLSQDLDRVHRLQGISREVRTHYKTFVNGAADAVDTGNLGTRAKESLDSTRGAIKRLQIEDLSQPLLGDIIGRLDYLAEGVKKDSSINSLVALREGIIKLDTEITKLDSDYDQLTEQAIVNTLKSAKDQKIVVPTAIAVTLLITVFFIRVVIRKLTRPLAEAEQAANRIAAGEIHRDLKIDTSNDLGQLLRSLRLMNDSLYKIIRSVQSAANAVASSTTEIAAGNSELSRRTEQQAASLEETASSMEELASTVKQNADHAKQANALAHGASEIASGAGKVMDEVVTTMRSINESAQKIVDIIGLIDSIAFQTNILALNAAVEAARAGEQGRGFAVVAAEVRNLAHRSAEAAREIKTLINDSVEKAEAGNKLVERAGETMEEVVRSIKQVTDIMAEISAASAEQSSGIDQVNVAIEQMDQVTQQNVGLVGKAAAASETLEKQAQKLSEAVGAFRLLDGDAGERGFLTPSNETPHPPAGAKRPASRAAPQRREGLERLQKKSQGTRTSARLPKEEAADGEWKEF